MCLCLLNCYTKLDAMNLIFWLINSISFFDIPTVLTIPKNEGNPYSITAKEGKLAVFICEFVKGDSGVTIYWTANGITYNCTTSAQKMDHQSDGCYTKDNTSTLFLRGMNPFMGGEDYVMQCVLQQNIPHGFKKDQSFEERLKPVRSVGRPTEAEG